MESEDRFIKLKPFMWIDSSEMLPADYWHVVAIYSVKEQQGNLLMPHYATNWCEAYCDKGQWFRETKDKAERLDNVLYWMEIEIPEELED